MSVRQSRLEGVVEIELRSFADDRGRFMELYREDRYREIGVPLPFVQDNFSVSKRHVLRGLHYQIVQPQGKLVTVLRGAVLDVVVDLRRSSPTFGEFDSFELSEENRRQLYVPPGFAHGFLTLAEENVVMYKCTDLYSPPHERTLIWNDPALGIDWPTSEPLVSPKDALGQTLANAETFA
jgi:dTDP-4-dehydrorhamnose 3,5-epimerase